MSTSAARPPGGNGPDAAWFDEARLGLFVHWGPASAAGRELSWPLVHGLPLLPAAAPVEPAEYYRGFEEFCPEPGAPRRWVAAARDAGMGYAVLTTKHHDGFALWPTRATDFSIARTPYRGDPVGEFAEACRAAGLRVGLYYSLSDWHHPDYPAYDGGGYLPYLGRRPAPDAWARYREVLFAQVRELCERYRPDLLWFDGQWERTADEWGADELAAMIRELCPGVLVTDRLPGHGDVETPEQALPVRPPDGRWETCLTMNRSWGHVPDDRDHKSVRHLVHTLCETAGRGGNLLVNVGPRGDGSLAPEQAERLAGIGTWMERYGESIRGTTPGLEPWQWYGPSTRRGDTVFLHLLWRPYETVTVRGVPLRRVREVREVASGRVLEHATRATVAEELSGDPVGEVVVRVPPEVVDDVATVLALDLAPV